MQYAIDCPRPGGKGAAAPVDRIVEDADGSPLFALTMARSEVRGASLEEVIEATVRALSKACREVIDTLTLSGRPTEPEVLRQSLDRKLTWDEVAAIMEDTASPEELDKAAARYRKRFQLVKSKLKRLANPCYAILEVGGRRQPRRRG